LTYRLGDSVSARLVEAAPFAGALRFEIVADEADQAPARRRARRIRAAPVEPRPSRKVARR
jgi:ribonuclease R